MLRSGGNLKVAKDAEDACGAKGLPLEKGSAVGSCLESDLKTMRERRPEALTESQTRPRGKVKAAGATIETYDEVKSSPSCGKKTFTPRDI